MTTQKTQLHEVCDRINTELGLRAWVESACALYSGRTVLFVDCPRRHDPATFFDHAEALVFFDAVKRSRMK